MLNLLKKYISIISNYEIIKWEAEPTTYRFVLNILFINDSKLFVKDYLFSNNRKYSFHWQDEKGNLIIRWDNAEHWKNISTFPFHKHIGDEVLSTNVTSIEDVLDYINSELDE